MVLTMSARFPFTQRTWVRGKQGGGGQTAEEVPHTRGARAGGSKQRATSQHAPLGCIRPAWPSIASTSCAAPLRRTSAQGRQA
jgi:hypothetical protein